MKLESKYLSQYLEGLRKWDGKTAFGLESIKKLLGAIENPQDKVKSFHIAGTNGKGSICLILSKILNYSGASVGTYLSPPIGNDLNRFLVNGKSISITDFERIGLQVAMLADQTGVAISQFEFFAIIAFIAFKELDFQVIEVGLGGRLDATNVLRNKEAAIISNIALDHTNLLGNTTSEIAAEKAGIIVSERPVIVGEVDSHAKDQIEKIAKIKNSPVFMYGRDFYLQDAKAEGEFTFVSAHEQFSISTNFKMPYQLGNLGVSIFASRMVGVSPESIRRAVLSIELPGRYECQLIRGTNFILDTAHNPNSVEKLIQILDSQDGQEFDCLFASYKDKNWQRMLDLLIPYIVNWNIVQVDTMRGVEPDELISYLENRGVASVSKIEGDDWRISSKRTVLICGGANLVNLFKSLHKLTNDIYWSC